MAGELLQHRHDHQAGGSGQGNVSAPPRPLFSWMNGLIDRSRIDKWIELFFPERKFKCSCTSLLNNSSNFHFRQS